MRILYLESPYSRFFYYLNRVLNPDFYEVLLFNIGYFIYFPTQRIIVVRKKLKDIRVTADDLATVRAIPSLANSNIRRPTDHELREMARYFVFLRDYINKNKITHIFSYNDLRWQHAIAKVVCVSLGVKTIFFEEGYFRPDTITMDDNGLNANALPTIEIVMRSNNEQKTNFKAMSPKFWQNAIKFQQFFVFLVLSKIGSIFSLNSVTQNKKPSFLNYLILMLLKIKSTLFARVISDSDIPSKKFVFVPLQVSGDTQTVIHSPFSDTSSAIKFIEQAFYAIPQQTRNDVDLVFKKHPMALNEIYEFDKRSKVSQASISNLVRKCEFMVTVNSSATIEALIYNKRTILLGRSIYSLAPICRDVDTIERLRSTIMEFLTNNTVSAEEKNTVAEYIAKLKYEYQLNCNYYNYKSRLLEVAQKVRA